MEFLKIKLNTEKRAMTMAKTASELAELGKKEEAESLLIEALKIIS